MRKLSFIGIILSVLWTGYWYGGSNLLQKTLTDLIAGEFGPEDPVQISHEGLKIQGFPRRFNAVLTNPSLTDTKNGILWNAAFMQVYAPSFKPYQITAIMAPRQILNLHGQEFQVNSSGMKAVISFAFRDFLKAAVVVQTLDFRLENLDVFSSLGWKTTLKSANLAFHKTKENPNNYNFDLLAKTITLPEDLRILFDPQGLQPEFFETLSIDGTLGFSKPFDLTATRDQRPELTEIRLDHLGLNWGPVKFTSQGVLKIDSEGYPDGTLNLTATGWKKMFRLARDSGLVDPEFAPTIQNSLSAMARMSDGDDVIKVPLNFSGGQMSLGIFPIGAAPRLK